ncbi:hypothetical protein P3342_001503 [Pyrenophora teres f. teres]|nr:hypothetical protein P3342_001503 [Pyrenophora teres f. teres]
MWISSLYHFAPASPRNPPYLDTHTRESEGTDVLRHVLKELEDLTLRIQEDRTTTSLAVRDALLASHVPEIGLLPGEDEDDVTHNESLFVREDELVDDDGDYDPSQRLARDEPRYMCCYDERVYFLDLVQIALISTYGPVECLRYGGREAPE